MATTLDLKTVRGSQDYPVIVSIYAKERWRDGWTLQTGLSADRIVWAASPSVGTAQLYWRYGYGKQPNAATFQQVARKSISRWWVKIVVDASSVTLQGTMLKKTWYGFVDSIADMVDGQVIVPSGRQSFLAYSLERLFYQSPIRHARVLPTTGGGFIHANGLTCNEQGKPNRHTTKSLFAEATATAAFWSTFDIVSYLVEYHSPKRGGQAFDPDQWTWAGVVTARLHDDAKNILPVFDYPEVPLHGRTAGQVFNSLMARQRLLGWRVDVVSVDNNERLEVVPFTFATSDIYVGGSNKIPRNPSTYHLDLHDASDNDVAIRVDSTGTFDQVIVEGGKRRSVFTVSATDGTLEAGWTSNDETTYRLGASTDPSYPASTEIDERRRRNAEARAADNVRDVYSKFALPVAWNFQSGDGEGGGKSPAFLNTARGTNPDDFTDAYRPYRPHVTFEPTLPLRANVDYSTGSSTPLGTGLDEELPPIILIKKPDAPNHYVPIEQAGLVSDLPTVDQDANHRWSASVRTNTREQEAAFYVKVSGQPQHVLGTDNFVPLAEDQDVGSYDWSDMVATVSVEDDRHVFGAWPDGFDVPDVDAVRVLRIQAGKNYRLDYMPDGTVLGVNPLTGALIKSPSPQWVNDDREALTRLARVAFQWYGMPRRVLSLSTTRVFNELSIGDVVVSVSRTPTENESVDTVVTQVSLELPRSASVQARGASMAIKTGFAELDPLKV